MCCRPGVYQTSNGTYQAQLRVDGIKNSFGTYGTAEDAAKAYDR
jgi:hypothetical protein